MDIILIGFGTVGKGLVEILRDKANDLRELYGFQARIVGVSTLTRGTLYHPDGLSVDDLLLSDDFDRYPNMVGLQRRWDAVRLVREGRADVMVEASTTNLQTAQPALDLCRYAFESGKHVVLANKGPVAIAYDELQARARATGKFLRFEATVMAGTPAIHVGMEALAGCRIEAVLGILNGTTNYILTEMEGGLSYDAALELAQGLGYAEIDPTSDVDGWDAAGKAMILTAALFGKKLYLDDMQIEGIRAITRDDILDAQAAGERWKLIAQITPDGASVMPRRVAADHPLASVSGANNAITYSTDLLGDVTLIGAGAGRQQTGFGLLTDLLDIHRNTY